MPDLASIAMIVPKKSQLNINISKTESLNAVDQNKNLIPVKSPEREFDKGFVNGE